MKRSRMNREGNVPQLMADVSLACDFCESWEVIVSKSQFTSQRIGLGWYDLWKMEREKHGIDGSKVSGWIVGFGELDHVFRDLVPWA